MGRTAAHVVPTVSLPVRHPEFDRKNRDAPARGSFDNRLPAAEPETRTTQ
jgi:hypothetical protein